MSAGIACRCIFGRNALSAIAFALLLYASSCSESVEPINEPEPEPECDWVWQNPKPHGYILQAVDSNSDGVAVIVGGPGTTSWSEDFGATWTTVSGFRPAALGAVRDVAVLSTNDAYAVGEDGKIAWRAIGDEFSLWIDRDSGTESRLMALDFYGDTLGVAVGDEGAVVRTIDGGRSWTAMGSVSGSDLWGVSIVDSYHCWAAGSGGAILFSGDGGQSWQPQDSGTEEHLTDVIFADVSHGIAAGPMAALYTEDGGNTWTPHEQLSAHGSIIHVDIQGATDGAAITSDGQLLTSSDGGATWQSCGPVATYRPQDIHIMDNQRIVVVGVGGSFHTTVDRGATWQGELFVTEDKLEDVVFVDALTGHAVGQLWGWGDGTSHVYSTHDGGATWSMTYSFDNDSKLQAIDFNGSSRGVLVGGDIRYTSNGGATWQISDISDVRLHAVDLVDNMAGYAAGSQGLVLKTTDGGIHWTELPNETAETIMGVSFYDENHGVAVGTQGVILRTLDGGSTWEEVPSGVVGELMAVDHADSLRVMAVGYAGVLYSEDGGESWARHQELGSRSHFYDIAFLDESIGAMAGEARYMYQTRDGGETWTCWPCSARNELYRRIYGVTFSGDDDITFVGEGGTIIRKPVCIY